MNIRCPFDANENLPCVETETSMAFNKPELNTEDDISEVSSESTSRKSIVDKINTTILQLEDAAEFFKEIDEQRRRRRRGILIIRCQRESLSNETRDRLMIAARERRAERRTSQVCQVSFDSITIREFPIMLGDNPGGLAGPPLTIQWKPHSTFTVPFEEYEETRPPRRSRSEMAIPPRHRQEMLRSAGYARGEIQEGTRPVNICRAQRARTKETQALDPASEIVEKIMRKTRNVMSLGALKRRERKFLEPYRKVFDPLKMRRSSSPDATNSTTIEMSEDLTV
jgi:hypothetical protein